MKRNIYTRQQTFWCVVRSRTPFRFGVMIDEEEERRKKERKKNKIDIFALRFCATLTKVSEILRVVLHLNSEGLLVHKLRTGLHERFRVTVPIPYVQDAILNLRHSYLRSATALRDTADKYMYIVR